MNSITNKPDIIQNMFLYRELNDEEINSLPYKLAIEKDKRTYCQYYISLLKKNNYLFLLFLQVMTII